MRNPCEASESLKSFFLSRQYPPFRSYSEICSLAAWWILLTDAAPEFALPYAERHAWKSSAHLLVMATCIESDSSRSRSFARRCSTFGDCSSIRAESTAFGGRRRATTGDFGRLTFELTGARRQDALARLVKMYLVPPTGPRWPAVARPVERGVRQHPATADGVVRLEEGTLLLMAGPLCFQLRAGEPCGPRL